MFRMFNRKYSLSSIGHAQHILSGQHALITGGSRGLGLAIAKNLSSKGCKVTLLARNETRLKANVKLLNEEYPVSELSEKKGHDYLVFDLANSHQIESFIKQQYPAYKQVNILINCAGISQHSLLIGSKPEEIQTIININLLSPIFLSKLFARSMMRLINPNIVNVSSLLSIQPSPGTSIYSITKSGLNSLTKNLSLEMQRKKIRVNAVLPGLIEDTDIGKGVNKDAISSANSLNTTADTNSASNITFPTTTSTEVASVVSGLVCDGRSSGELVVVPHK
ncbi:unnamed protein product [Ambrosiozyma monospora]|uniref:Unnamed protein product n=1 Tax=Ambrosiozyma monospora TaxID=43982 RepID=A0A9W6Z4G9_AMBMO|nr:unnamed protein product [Ambrosiozyma monospora]